MNGTFNRNNAYTKFQPAPRRDKYNRQDTRVEYQIFSSDYFSGADVHLYLGDIWIDEINEFQFQMQEQVMPIFGYHSYTPDVFARGTRVINGQFKLNFRSVGYLQEILKYRDAIQYAYDKGKDSLGKRRLYENYKLDEVLKLYGKESFEEIAEDYEKAIWGESDDDSLLNPGNIPYFQADDREGFDIRIVYGPSDDVERNRGRYKNNAAVDHPEMTIEIINGVQLYGVSKVISTADQGAPVQEVYNFMARDLNGSLK